MGRPVRRLAGAALLAGLLAGCRDGTVTVTFRPRVGSTYRYEVRVRTVSEVRIGDGPLERRSDDVVITAEHTVLRAGHEGARVRVLLSAPGTVTRAYVVDFDRAAQLQSVESIQGLPDERLADLGIAEVFPAAAGAPPDRPLAPGETWTFDDRVRVPGATRMSHLTGNGRLTELGVVDGRHVARVASTSRLPLTAIRPSARGSLRLVGEQATQYRASHDVDDGSVEEASSTSVGTYRLALVPTSSPNESVPGTLVVRVSSTTRRIG